MTIIEKIAESVHEALDTKDACGNTERVFPFYYDTPETINVRLDHADFPCAFLHVIESGVLADVNGILKERLTCQVLFAAPTVLDFDGLENEEIIDDLKRAAFIWLQVLKRSGDLKLASVQNTQRLYATEDAIVTAFGVTCDIEEVDGISFCDLPYKVGSTICTDE